MSGTIVLAGGSGFIGKALRDEFGSRGYSVVVLSRSGRNQRGARDLYWDAQNLGPWTEALNGAKAVVNLAGSTIARRWDKAVIRDLYDSRLGPTRLLGKAIENLQKPPPVWINASGIGYYGDTGNEEDVDESHAPASDLVGDLAQKWEAAQDEATLPSTRRVKLRIGMVLGEGGGAYPVLAKFARLFLGGHQGSGTQWVPWIHLKDLTRLFAYAVENPLEGPYNACAPNPVTNAELMAQIRRACDRPWAPPAPAFALTLANKLFGAPEPSLVLGGQKAVPRRAVEAGFSFIYPDLDLAIRELRTQG